MEEQKKKIKICVGFVVELRVVCGWLVKIKVKNHSGSSA